jgi:hypothetical protein
MPTYVNTIIYKICCKDECITECYVGHTTNLKQRKIEHRYGCNNEMSKSYNIPVYQFIRANGGYDNWEFIQIEEYPCETKKQATCRENYWVFELNATLNSIMPIFNMDNLIQYNKKKSDEMKLKTIEKRKHQKEERQKYLEDHKEEIQQHKKEVRREYDIKNRELINMKKREHNSKTKERRAELNKQYYEKRKASGYYKTI